MENLSTTAKKLLNNLIQDYKSGIPANERQYELKDNEPLLYNLFCGNYNFSYKIFKELHIFLTKQ